MAKEFDADARKQGNCGYISDELDEPCGHTEGWGYPNATSGFCEPHGDRSGQEGNAGGDGGPENNLKALKTGDNVAADRWIEFIEDHADDELKDIFKANFERFRKQGADPVVATRLAVLRSKADFNHMELLKSDFMRPLYHEGEYVDDVFDSERDSSALQNEREVRLGRREDKLSPYSRDDDVVDGLESIADVIAEVSDS